MESAAGMWDMVGADNSNSWQSDGACSAPDVDPDLHFPITEGGSRHSELVQNQIDEAKRMCAGCPVLSQCRAYGFTQPYGIWGGLTEEERRAIKRRSLTLSPVERRAITARAARTALQESVTAELAKGA